MIPLTRPDISQAEMTAVCDVMASGWLTTGPKVAEFEKAFGEACNGHAVAVSSATAGLHLALLAANVRGCCGVLVPVWTFSATAEAVEMAGMKPIFCDIDPVTLALTGVSGAAKHDGQISVHIAGLRAPVAGYGPVIEDAAHCLPFHVTNPTVFSFHANKPITTGEGGMVVFPNEYHAERCRDLRLHGMDTEAHARKGASHEIVRRGFKYNMTDIQAAMGLEQFKRAPETRTRRIRQALRYRTEVRGCIFPQTSVDHSWHLFIARVPDRDSFIAAMAERGVRCGIHYEPLHRHAYWRDKYKLTPEMFPNAEAARRQCVSLPLFSAMTDDEQSRVIEAANEVLC